MTARNANDATTIRTELKAWGLSSRNALLMTEKLLPQMIVIRSRRASRGLKNRRRNWGVPVTGRCSSARRPGWSPDAAAEGSALRRERLEEEQDQRNQQHVDREGLDQDQTEEQRSADVAGGRGIARNAFRRGADRPALRERRQTGRERQREPGGDDRPLRHLGGRSDPACRLLRVQRRGRAGNQHEHESHDGTFAHDQNPPENTRD